MPRLSNGISFSRVFTHTAANDPCLRRPLVSDQLAIAEGTVSVAAAGAEEHRSFQEVELLRALKQARSKHQISAGKLPWLGAARGS